MNCSACAHHCESMYGVVLASSVVIPNPLTPGSPVAARRSTSGMVSSRR